DLEDPALVDDLEDRPCDLVERDRESVECLRYLVEHAYEDRLAHRRKVAHEVVEREEALRSFASEPAAESLGLRRHLVESTRAALEDGHHLHPGIAEGLLGRLSARRWAFDCRKLVREGSQPLETADSFERLLPILHGRRVSSRRRAQNRRLLCEESEPRDDAVGLARHATQPV